ncbi:hypothetical protein, partial [Mailhella sp.]|uniref:hypothetical protein n=1 Tax=Mailhella sp. TaxID=1981029 RepID=UPI004062941A
MAEVIIEAEAFVCQCHGVGREFIRKYTMTGTFGENNNDIVIFCCKRNGSGSDNGLMKKRVRLRRVSVVQDYPCFGSFFYKMSEGK